MRLQAIFILSASILLGGCESIDVGPAIGPQTYFNPMFPTQPVTVYELPIHFGHESHMPHIEPGSPPGFRGHR